MNYLTRKNFWSCHSFCIYRERSIKYWYWCTSQQFDLLKWSFFVAQRCGCLGAGWSWSLRNRYFYLSIYRTIVYPWPISIFEPTEKLDKWKKEKQEKTCCFFLNKKIDFEMAIHPIHFLKCILLLLLWTIYLFRFNFWAWNILSKFCNSIFQWKLLPSLMCQTS